jgi:hypothetical protein
MKQHHSSSKSVSYSHMQAKAVTNKKLLYIYEAECVFHECRKIYSSSDILVKNETGTSH